MEAIENVVVVIARSEATKQSRASRGTLDCFAEPVIGPRFARTRWLAMTLLVPIELVRIEKDAGDDEQCRHRQHVRECFRGRPLGGFLHAGLSLNLGATDRGAKTRKIARIFTRNTPRRIFA